MADKTISFLNIALQATQEEVFGFAIKAAKTYDPGARAVALTMNMDYMDDEAPPMRFESQLSDVMDIKRHFPADILPFLGIDPRHKGGEEVVQWAKRYFETGFNALGRVWPYFVGAKIYPALGFFPFDERLFPLYDYLQQNEIPVITHCTRVGSQYIGKNIEALIPRNPTWTHLDTSKQAVQDAMTGISDRIAKYHEKGWIKNNELGENDFACDLFTHPENYIPVLEHFPNLKLCIAHLGGSNEIYAEKVEDDLVEIRKIDGRLWFDHIREMMLKYGNLYADISYTLSSFEDKKLFDRVNGLIVQDGLKSRILFGTDFFMTEQEMREAELYELTKIRLAGCWKEITTENPRRFLAV